MPTTKSRKKLCCRNFPSNFENKTIMLKIEKSHKIELKSILGFENWTKKMSKIEKRKHFPAFFFDVTRKNKNKDIFSFLR